MASPSSHILRIKQSATSGANVLLHVTQTRPGSLDLKLIATEQEHLYHSVIKESSLKSLQAERYVGTLEEFKSILRTTLLQEEPEKSFENADDIEITAAIDDDTLTINLRRNTAGIKSPICSIICIQDDEREAISFPEWVDTAVAASESVNARCRGLQASASSFEEQILKLTAQLDDIVAAKKAHEEDLLKKFAMLLNAKKLKIRDQQRLLSDLSSDKTRNHTTGYDERTRQRADDSNMKPNTGRRATTKSSRIRKRKADDDDDGDEIMADGAHESDTGDDDPAVSTRQSTPTPEADEDSADDAFTAAYPLSQADQHGTKSGERHKGVEHVTNSGSGETEEIPPQRALPFSKVREKASATTLNDESTDDDSDEI